MRTVISGRSLDEGPDLGGGHFELLKVPKVALFSNTRVSSASFGHVWSYLDQELGMPVTLVGAQAYRGVDLARYNVLIAPEGLGDVLEDHEDGLADWVRAGGTLVAIGSSKKALDAWRRGFAPAGVILRAELDPHAWITAGVVPGVMGAQELPAADPGEGESKLVELAVPFAGASILMPAVRPAVRLAGEERLRLAGLLWPEARIRTANSAWLTVERLGRGQVISFVSSPVFRGSWRGTSRLLGNAVLVGPGATD